MVFKNESVSSDNELNGCYAPGTIVDTTFCKVDSNVTLRAFKFSPEYKSQLPKILFIPGWISHIQSWKAVLFELTKKHEVIYLETREKISSNVDTTAQFTINTIGDDLAHFVKMTIQPNDTYAIFASSLGATVALDICQELTPRPMAMTLVAPNAVFRVPPVMKIFVYLIHPKLYLMAKPIVKTYLKHFRLDTDNDMAQYQKYCRALDSADPWKLKKAVMSFWNYSVWHKLTHIQIPTLIIGASKDKLHEPENLRQIASQLSNAKYVDLETNAAAHQANAVKAMHHFLKKL